MEIKRIQIKNNNFKCWNYKDEQRSIRKNINGRRCFSAINNNLELLLSIIPELESMMGFEHKHPHHHLDVWDHTLLALSRAPKDMEIRLVLLLHDIGKPFSYQEGEIRHFKGHPVVSSMMSKVILTRLNYTKQDIEELTTLIKDHDNLISDLDIRSDIEYCKKKFKVQFCDALAHNPLKLEKIITYLLEVNEKINTNEEEKAYYEFLAKMKK